MITANGVGNPPTASVKVFRLALSRNHATTCFEAASTITPPTRCNDPAASPCSIAGGTSNKTDRLLTFFSQPFSKCCLLYFTFNSPNLISRVHTPSSTAFDKGGDYFPASSMLTSMRFFASLSSVQIVPVLPSAMAEAIVSRPPSKTGSGTTISNCIAPVFLSVTRM